jgi:hypothetical protein
MLGANCSGVPRSFTGNPLKGSALVRIVYLDEAGISKPEQEPYLVIAAVIVHGDKDTGRITKALEKLVKEYGLNWIGEFHAKDIWHGSGVFDRDNPKWPLPRRRALLARLAALPKELSLPVAIGYVHRKTYDRALDDYSRQLERNHGITRERSKLPAHVAQYGEAFARVAKAVDTWMQKNAPRERAMLIAEDAPQVKRELKLIQSIFQSKNMDIQFLLTDSFKTEHIIETVHFAGKKESPFLQLADTCAFVAKRKLMRKADIDEIYARVEPQIIRLRRTREPFKFDPYRGFDE